MKDISKRVQCDIRSFVEKNEKLNEEMLFYNQSIKDAQNQIKLKNDKLQEIDQRSITEKSRSFKIHQNDEGMRYNFGKRKSKFTNKDSVCKKKLRATNEGRENNTILIMYQRKKSGKLPKDRKNNRR